MRNERLGGRLAATARLVPIVGAIACTVTGCGKDGRSEPDEKAVPPASVSETEYRALRERHRSSKPGPPANAATGAGSYYEKVELGTWKRNWADGRAVEQQALDAKLTLEWGCIVEDVSERQLTVCSTAPRRTGRFVLLNQECGVASQIGSDVGDKLHVALSSPMFVEADWVNAPSAAADPEYPVSEYGVLVASCREEGQRLLGTSTPEERTEARCRAGDRVACRVAGDLALYQRENPASALELYEVGCTLESDDNCFHDRIKIFKAISQDHDAIASERSKEVRLVAEAACERGEIDGCELAAVFYRDGIAVAADKTRASDFLARVCRLDTTSPACADACDLGNRAACTHVGPATDGDQEADGVGSVD